MIDLLDLHRSRLARSVAKIASLAVAAVDLAWRLFGWCSLLGLSGFSTCVTFVLEQIRRKLTFFHEIINLR